MDYRVQQVHFQALGQVHWLAHDQPVCLSFLGPKVGGGRGVMLDISHIWFLPAWSSESSERTGLGLRE